jgi:hypothetical protein
MLRDALREHVNALAVDIGPRTPWVKSRHLVGGRNAMAIVACNAEKRGLMSTRAQRAANSLGATLSNATNRLWRIVDGRFESLGTAYWTR